MRNLSNTEYEELIGTYSVEHFMGGFRGINREKFILLVRDEIYLIDELERDTLAVRALMDESIQEAKEYLNLRGGDVNSLDEKQ